MAEEGVTPDLEFEGPERAPSTSTKSRSLIRPFRLPVELMSKFRQLAAINGLSISAVVSRLLADGLEIASYRKLFPPLPTNWVVTIKDSDGETRRQTAESKYFIPEEVNSQIEEIVSMGYSSRLVIQTCIEEGLDNAARRARSKNREAVDAGEVAHSPEGSLHPDEPQDGVAVPETPEGGV